MKKTFRGAIVTAAAVLAAACMLAPWPGFGQEQTDDAKARAKAEAKAKQIAQNFENNARTLAMFDRQGKRVSTVGRRDLYGEPVFSPDRTRLAVTKRDLERQTQEVWVLEIATGNATQVTISEMFEGPNWPVWSPDGQRLAFVKRRGSREGIYQRAADGSGAEELLAQLPGAGAVLTDWSADGKFLHYYTSDLGGNVSYVLPLEGERKPVEVARSATQLAGERVSPDRRLQAYSSEESGKSEIYVRTLDASGGSRASPQKWQVSDHGGTGVLAWSRDGKELYYMAPDRGVMVVEVDNSAGFQAGPPKLLFRAPLPFQANGNVAFDAAISADGQRVVLAIPRPPPLFQMSLVDRQGKVLKTVGEPGLYNGRPMLSADGEKAAVAKIDMETGDRDLWIFDLAKDTSTRLFTDSDLGSWVWSPDGSEIAYSSFHDPSGAVYRRAADGSGTPQLIFRQAPGVGFALFDWSADGRFLTFNSGSVLFLLPLDGDRKPVELIREEYSIGQALLSPDSRFYLYQSDESGTNQAWLQAFDPSAVAMGPAAQKWRLTDMGAGGPLSWGRDGKEVSFRNGTDVAVVEFTTSPEFKAEPPKVLFQAPPGAGNASGSRNGERWLFLTPVAEAP